MEKTHKTWLTPSTKEKKVFKLTKEIIENTEEYFSSKEENKLFQTNPVFQRTSKMRSSMGP